MKMEGRFVWRCKPLQINQLSAHCLTNAITNQGDEPSESRSEPSSLESRQ